MIESNIKYVITAEREKQQMEIEPEVQTDER